MKGIISVDRTLNLFQMRITNRRAFITKSLMGIAGLSVTNNLYSSSPLEKNQSPVVISTGEKGVFVNEPAWEILLNGGYSLDAVEAGIRFAEEDPDIKQAGLGSLPDVKGKISLNACIMNDKGISGSVNQLQCIKHPVSVARYILENPAYITLSGKEALNFAVENGFEKEKLLNREMKKKWRNWKKKKEAVNSKTIHSNHRELIGMLALDSKGRLSGACSASGITYQMPGLTGDSCIIGAGLFVNGITGSAVASGPGEILIKTMGAFLVVEFMREGMTPTEACNAALKRVIDELPGYHESQIGFVALDKFGNTGAASLNPGFNYAIKSSSFSGVREAGSWYKTW